MRMKGYTYHDGKIKENEKNAGKNMFVKISLNTIAKTLF